MTRRAGKRHNERVAVSTDCPFCGAAKGEPCWNANDRQTYSFVHWSRSAAYRPKRGKFPKGRSPRPNTVTDWTDTYRQQTKGSTDGLAQ